MAGSSRSTNPKVSIIGSVIPTSTIQSSSTIIEAHQASRVSSSASPISSFVPSNANLDRTSPEGRSWEDINQDNSDSPESDAKIEGVNQTDNISIARDNYERSLEEITSISSYFQTPTSHLSQSKSSHQGETPGKGLNSNAQEYKEPTIALDDDTKLREDETSISSFSTFYTPTSQEDIQSGGEDMAENIDTETHSQLKNESSKDILTLHNQTEHIETNNDLLIDNASLCSFKTTVENYQQDDDIGQSYGDVQIDKKKNSLNNILNATVDIGVDNISLASFCSFQTPMSTLSLDWTNEEDQEAPTVRLLNQNIADRNDDRVSMSSQCNFYTPASGLSIDFDEYCDDNQFENLKIRDVVEKAKNSVSSKSTPNLIDGAHGDEKTSGRSSFSEVRNPDAADDQDIISSFSTFNKLMEQLNEDHSIKQGDFLKEDVENSNAENNAEISENIDNEATEKSDDMIYVDDLREDTTSSAGSSYNTVGHLAYVRLESDDPVSKSQTKSEVRSNSSSSVDILSRMNSTEGCSYSEEQEHLIDEDDAAVENDSPDTSSVDGKTLIRLTMKYVFWFQK